MSNINLKNELISELLLRDIQYEYSLEYIKQFINKKLFSQTFINENIINENKLMLFNQAKNNTELYEILTLGELLYIGY